MGFYYTDNSKDVELAQNEISDLKDELYDTQQQLTQAEKDIDNMNYLFEKEINDIEQYYQDLLNKEKQNYSNLIKINLETTAEIRKLFNRCRKLEQDACDLYKDTRKIKFIELILSILVIAVLFI